MQNNGRRPFANRAPSDRLSPKTRIVPAESIVPSSSFVLAPTHTRRKSQRHALFSCAYFAEAEATFPTLAMPLEHIDAQLVSPASAPNGPGACPIVTRQTPIKRSAISAVSSMPDLIGELDDRGHQPRFPTPP
jgi:hypothetical protein